MWFCEISRFFGGLDFSLCSAFSEVTQWSECSNYCMSARCSRSDEMVSFISSRSGCDSVSVAGGATDMPGMPMRVCFLRTAYVRVPSVGLILWRAVLAFCLLQSFVDLGVYCSCGMCLHLSFDHSLLRRSSCPSHLLDSLSRIDSDDDSSHMLFLHTDSDTCSFSFYRCSDRRRCSSEQFGSS